MKGMKLSVALTLCAIALASIGAGTASAEFGITKFTNAYQDISGAPAAQAGSHADVVTDLTFDTAKNGAGTTVMDGQVRDIEVNLPAGFYGNPQVAHTCSMEGIVLGEGICNPAAQVGTLDYEIAPGFLLPFPVYNLPSADEQTAVLAVVAVSIPAKIVISARTDGDYGLTANLTNLNQGLALTHTALTLWGVPADPIHDSLRFKEGGGLGGTGASAGVEPKPFLSMPPRCGPVSTELRAASWQNPDIWHTATYTSPALEGCDILQFAPTLKARPTTNAADSPSGLDAELHLPYSEDPEDIADAHLKRAEVTLPEGLVINPSGANGLNACAPTQIGLMTPAGAGSPHFSKAPAACPDASRIGSVESTTPALADPIKGSVYAATPTQNPFGNLLTVYAVMEGKGLVIKIAGMVSADPVTGRLTALFDEIPQFPFDLKMSFFSGATGVLRTPSICGTYATTGTLTPWTAPVTPSAPVNDTYSISRGANGQGCASSEAQLPHKPAFDAASAAAIAGSYQPFAIDLRREDGSQQFAAVTLTPPPGLVAKLAGTAICSDAALAAAAAKTGSAEKASPSCPVASEVGNVIAAAGAGPAPFNAPGKAYLTGPYKGAPLSLAIITPATAGPYDLGTIAVRTALYIDPTTAQVTAKSDPIPRILEGIPLDVRSVSIRLDKPQFTLNPTDCIPSKVTGTLLSTAGAGAALDNRFQLAECGRLKFKPSLSFSLKGKTKRSGHPALTAVLKPRAGDANIASVSVALPHSEFLAQNHIRTVCTRVQFAADQCPKGSIYGKVSVVTPILDEPLTGPVYLRSSSNPLPDMVVDLHGPASQPIRFEAAGRIDSVNGGIRNTFDFVPDVPFTKLTLQLQGGKKGLLENSRSICRSTNRADVSYTAHNGASYSIAPTLKAECASQNARGRRPR
jgi:hypothetical protein